MRSKSRPAASWGWSPRGGLTTWLLWTAMAGASASPCAAQHFAAPLDLNQGLVFRADRPRTPYLFEASLAPGVDFGRVQLNALVAPSYLNPGWDLAWGARVGWLVPIQLHDLGFRFSAQVAYLPWQAAVHASLGVQAEAFGLVRFGLWPGYDFETKHVQLTSSIGIDLVSWVLMLSGPRETEFEPVP